MDDVKLAILRTFENTVKALLNANVECVFDSDQSNDQNASLEMIYDHLQNIRQEFADIKNRLQRIESVINNRTDKSSSPWSKPLFPTNIVIELDNDKPTVMDRAEIEPVERSVKTIHLPVQPRKKDTTPISESEQYPSQDDSEIIIIPSSIKSEKKSNVVENGVEDEVEEEEGEVEEEAEEEDEAEEEAEEGDVEEEAEAEEEEGEVEEEAEAEEEEGEAEEEQEGVELEEFKFEGKVYYKDEENIVYTTNKDGELNDTPIGRWSEKTKSIKYFKS